MSILTILAVAQLACPHQALTMARKKRNHKHTSNSHSTSGAAAATTTEVEQATESGEDSSEGDSMTIASDGEIELHQDTQTDRNAADTEQSLVSKVESNGWLLEQLLEQITDLRQQIASTQSGADSSSEGEPSFEAERERFEQQIFDYQDRIAELERQNEELAGRVASTNVRKAVACSDSGSNDALSWEDRKRQMLEQMEEDSFDAEAFVADLSGDSSPDEPLDPAAYMEQLHDEHEKMKEDLQRRDEEIRELRCLLDQQSGTREGGVAVGAAAIAQMVDSDELVQQERQRLQTLQEEWEEKFRQGEIEASLERAKISRERLELARKNSELEERLEHLRRETRQAEEGTAGGTSRRWLAKLGLSESE